MISFGLVRFQISIFTKTQLTLFTADFCLKNPINGCNCCFSFTVATIWVVQVFHFLLLALQRMSVPTFLAFHILSDRILNHNPQSLFDLNSESVNHFFLSIYLFLSNSHCSLTSNMPLSYQIVCILPIYSATSGSLL